MLNRYSIFMAGMGGLLFGCSHDAPKNLAAPAPAKPQLMAPFRYHKMIEVAPGQDFDVMSWGRGSTTTGSLLILHSDSAAKKFITTTGDIDGAITDVFNSDMDVDGNPELLIEAKAKDTVDYTTIYAYEFTDTKAQKLDFPKLTSSQKKGYRGADNFYMKDGKLIREFPVYDSDSSNAKQTPEKRILQYSLRNNSLTVKELSKDNTATTSGTTTAPATTEAPKKAGEASNSKKSSSSRRSKKATSHKSEKKKKKKHHRG